MANIDLMKVGIAVGIGALDEVLERQDDGRGRVDFKRWSNWSRLLLAAGGWGFVAIGPSQYASWAETAAIAATPLLTKGIGKVVVKEGSGKAYQQYSARFQPRRVETGAATQDWAPERAGGQYRPL